MSLSFDLSVRRDDFTLVAAANLEQPVTALFGRSGSGKSTMLAALAGLGGPVTGRIELDGDVLLDSSRGVVVPPHQRRIGVVFQDGRLFPHLDVTGNLRFGQRLLATGEQRLKLDTVVELLELSPLLHRRIGALSGGERQRVTLGRALLSSPRLLLLDEPLSALDRRLKRQVMPFLRRVRDELGIPMLYVTHELPEALQITDHLLLLDHGRVAGFGRYLDLAMSAEVLAHYSELVNVFTLQVRQQDADNGLTVLVDASDRLTVVGPLCDTPVGQPVSISLYPEDVALALDHVDDISVRNQLQGTIVRLTAFRGQAFVEVDVGLPLLVEVTQQTVKSLRLDVGKPVWCLFKANAAKFLL